MRISRPAIRTSRPSSGRPWLASATRSSVKSTGPGTIPAGFLTCATTAHTAVYAHIVIDRSTLQYGYVEDGHWHAMSIPISATIALATPACGQPATVKLDMTTVAQPFTIADLYASTGKTSGSPGYGDMTSFYADDIDWSKQARPAGRKPPL